MRSRTKWLIVLFLLAIVAFSVVRFLRAPGFAPPPTFDTSSDSTEPASKGDLVTNKPGPDDWAGFLGPDTCGAVAAGDKYVTTWNDDQNVVWRAELPGPGASSPIIVGDCVLVTCYSGYAVEPEQPGELTELKRHLMCFGKDSGELKWKKTIDSRSSDQAWESFMRYHGYASNTPVSDGARVFVLFGRAGVFAFDLKGEQLWQRDVGEVDIGYVTGSGASLTIAEGQLIVNASNEGKTVFALDPLTGNEVWKSKSESLERAFSTPVVVTNKDGEKEIIIAAPGSVLALSPATGSMLWFAKTKVVGSVAPTIVADGANLFATGFAADTATVSVTTGGRGDVSESRIRWTSRYGSDVASPIIVGDLLFLVTESGRAYCIDKLSGKNVGRRRLEGEYYASLAAVGNRIYAVSLDDGVTVFEATPEMKTIAQNELDSSRFLGTPAFSAGRIFLRSNRFLYCLGE